MFNHFWIKTRYWGKYCLLFVYMDGLPVSLGSTYLFENLLIWKTHSFHFSPLYSPTPRIFDEYFFFSWNLRNFANLLVLNSAKKVAKCYILDHFVKTIVFKCTCNVKFHVQMLRNFVKYFTLYLAEYFVSHFEKYIVLNFAKYFVIIKKILFPHVHIYIYIHINIFDTRKVWKGWFLKESNLAWNVNTRRIKLIKIHTFTKYLNISLHILDFLNKQVFFFCLDNFTFS